MKKLTKPELEREIERVEQILDKSKSNYLTHNLTRYLRRLQKQRHKMNKENL